MTDGAPVPVPPQTTPAALPHELEARIAALENAAPRPVFDAASWFWLILLGVAIPLLLLAAGWWA
jgi:hypothetical protein